MVEQSTLSHEQEAKEQLLTKEVSGFGIRTELGMMAGGYGEFLTTQPIAETTTRNTLNIYLNQKGYEQVNTTSLQQYSTHERDSYAGEKGITTSEQYQLWENWMSNWINEAGEPQKSDLYKDRIAGLSALGIQREEIRTWHSQTEDARNAIIARLHTDYFQGDTNIDKLTDDLIESARGNNGLISINILTNRLNAMEPFLASCGEGSKDAIKQHILLQGVARSDDQKTKDSLIEIAPEQINKLMSKKQIQTIYSFHKGYDQLPRKANHPTRPTPGALLPVDTLIDNPPSADQTGGRTRKTPAYQYNVYPSTALPARPTSQAEIEVSQLSTQEANRQDEDIITLKDPKRAIRQMKSEIKKSKEDKITFGMSPEILKGIVERIKLGYGARLKTDIIIESGRAGEKQLVLSGIIDHGVVGKLIDFDINLQNDNDGLAVSKREISYSDRLNYEQKAMVEAKLNQLNESIKNGISKQLGGNISVERFNIGDGVLVCTVRKDS